MTDATTQARLRVSSEGTMGPYIRVPFSQLEEVKQTLDGSRIRYWVGENAISLDGGPEFVVIDLGRAADASAIQAVLDSVR